MKKLLIPLALILGTFILAPGAASAHLRHWRPGHRQVVVVRPVAVRPVPVCPVVVRPARIVVRPVTARIAQVWIAGHWEWRGPRYGNVWIAGYFI